MESNKRIVELLASFSTLNNCDCFHSLLFQAVVDSVLTIRRPGYPIDLFMVEIMEMKHKSETDTK